MAKGVSAKNPLSLKKTHRRDRNPHQANFSGLLRLIEEYIIFVGPPPPVLEPKPMGLSLWGLSLESLCFFEAVLKEFFQGNFRNWNFRGISGLIINNNWI